MTTDCWAMALSPTGHAGCPGDHRPRRSRCSGSASWQPATACSARPMRSARRSRRHYRPASVRALVHRPRRRLPSGSGRRIPLAHRLRRTPRSTAAATVTATNRASAATRSRRTSPRASIRARASAWPGSWPTAVPPTARTWRPTAASLRSPRMECPSNPRAARAGASVPDWRARSSRSTRQHAIPRRHLDRISCAIDVDACAIGKGRCTAEVASAEAVGAPPDEPRPDTLRPPRFEPERRAPAPARPTAPRRDPPPNATSCRRTARSAARASRSTATA